MEQVEIDRKYLQLAIEQARKSVKEGGFPAGAVVVKDDQVVAEGVSLGDKLNDPTAHGETTAIREACNKLETTNLDGATLYASMRPCLMCFSVCYWSGIGRIVYGCSNERVSPEYYEGVIDLLTINGLNNRHITMVHLVRLGEESLKVIKQWEDTRS